MRNSPAILSHFLTSSYLLPSYKITKQLSSHFWNISKPSSTTLKMFWIIKWRVRFFKFGWGSRTIHPHYNEKGLDLYISWAALLGPSQLGLFGLLHAEKWQQQRTSAVDAGHAQIEKDLFQKQRAPELVFCGCLTAACSDVSQSP